MEIWMYLVAVIAILVVSFVLYVKYKLITKEHFLEIIDFLIVEDEKLLDLAPPEELPKIKLKLEALRVLRRAIEEDWIPQAIESKLLEAYSIKL